MMINVAVVGYGYWGPNLVRNFMEATTAQVDVVADLDTTRLAQVALRYPTIRTTTKFSDILANPAIHAVAIATPVSTHFDLGMAALRAGKHIWLEKPMTETAAQAHRLADEAQRRNLVLFVDHTFVYTSAVRKIGELIKRSELGSIYYYDSTRINLGIFQTDVSVIADLASHDFSILLHVLKEKPAAVSVCGASHFNGGQANVAYVTLFYESGTLAHLNVSWLSPIKVRQIFIGGSEKMIVYDDLQASEKVKVYDAGVDFRVDPERVHEMRIGYRSGDMWAPKLSMKEALQLGSEHFCDCIRNGSEPETGGLLGARVVELIEGATESMRGKGKTVYLGRGAQAA